MASWRSSGTERDDEVAAEGVGDAGEGAESVAGAAAFFEAGDDGLGVVIVGR